MIPLLLGVSQIVGRPLLHCDVPCHHTWASCQQDQSPPFLPANLPLPLLLSGTLIADFVMILTSRCVMDTPLSYPQGTPTHSHLNLNVTSSLLPVFPQCHALFPASPRQHILLSAFLQHHMASPLGHTLLPASLHHQSLLLAFPQDHTLLPASPQHQFLLLASPTLLTETSGRSVGTPLPMMDPFLLMYHTHLVSLTSFLQMCPLPPFQGPLLPYTLPIVSHPLLLLSGGTGFAHHTVGVAGLLALPAEGTQLLDTAIWCLWSAIFMHSTPTRCNTQ